MERTFRIDIICFFSFKWKNHLKQCTRKVWISGNMDISQEAITGAVQQTCFLSYEYGSLLNHSSYCNASKTDYKRDNYTQLQCSAASTTTVKEWDHGNCPDITCQRDTDYMTLIPLLVLVLIFVPPH